MAQPIPGVLTQISFAKESTWGTAVTPTKSIPVRPSGGIATDNNIKLLSALKATEAKNYDSMIGARKHEGTYSMDLFCDYPGYFMMSALGGVSSALKGGETIVYQHTLTENTTKPSLTIEQGWGSNVQRFAGSLCDSFKITAKQDDVATFEPKVMAKSQASATQITAAYLTARPFNFADLLLKIGGTTVTEVTDFEMEYKTNLDMIYGLNANDPINFVPKGSEVTGKITMVLDSTTLTQFTNYLNKTTTSLELIGTGDAIGSSSNNMIDVMIRKAVYKTVPIKLTDAYNVLEINFDGIYDTGTSQLLNIVLTNTLTALT